MFDRMLDHPSGGRARRAGLAVLLALSLTAGATSCGSDDDPPKAGDARAGDRGQSDPAGAASERAARSGSDEEQIRWLLDDLQSDYISGDGAGYCSSLTAAGRRQVADVAESLEHGSTCEDFVATTSRMTREAGIEQKPTKLISARIDGDRAVATVSDGGRPATAVVFVKRGGRWKLPDPGFKAALSGQAQPPAKGPAPQSR